MYSLMKTVTTSCIRFQRVISLYAYTDKGHIETLITTPKTYLHFGNVTFKLRLHSKGSYRTSM